MTCKEMRGKILRIGWQNDSTTIQSIYSMHRWPPLHRRRNEICWRIVTSMLSNCSEMLILGTNWTTWYFMVSEQTCSCNHKLDQSLSHTLSTFDLVHPSHMWIKTKCHVGNTAQQCRLGLFQDSDFAGDLEDSTSTWGGLWCIFGSQTFVPISWMCKKQTFDSHARRAWIGKEMVRNSMDKTLSTWKRRIEKAKRKGTTSFRFNGSDDIIE